MSPAPYSSMVGAQQAQHQAQPLTRRRLIAVAAGSAGAFGAAACSGIGSQSAKPAATLNQPASLVWLNWEGGASQLEGNTKTIEDFQARYPQIKVENAAQTTTGNYWDKHAALTAAGTPADLWEWEPQNVVDYVLRKQVLDIQPLVARDHFDLSDFFKKGVDQYRWRGGLWGLPRDFPNRELFYNVTEFQKNGVALPASDWKNPGWTWDAFLDAARRVTKPDGSQIGFNTGRGIRMWAVWVWANGGEVIDETKLECTLDRQPAIEALQFLQDLIHKHRVMAATLPPGASFAGGQVIINENAPAGLGNTRRDVADKFVWDVVMHPHGPNGRYAAAGGGAGWAISAQTKAPEAAWAFLQFVTSSEQQIRLCQLGATIGSRRSVMTNPCFLQTPPAHVQLFIDGTEYLHVDVRVAGWSDVNQVFSEELADLWSGQRPAREIVRTIKSRVDPILTQAAKQAGG